MFANEIPQTYFEQMSLSYDNINIETASISTIFLKNLYELLQLG